MKVTDTAIDTRKDNMITKTGNNFIPRTTTVRIEIPTANLGHSITASLTIILWPTNRKYLGYYISETMIDKIEISTANLRLLTTASSIKVYPNNCHSDRHRKWDDSCSGATLTILR